MNVTTSELKPVGVFEHPGADDDRQPAAVFHGKHEFEAVLTRLPAALDLTRHDFAFFFRVEAEAVAADHFGGRECRSSSPGTN